MKNKKGFTLIEMLAVISILIIIITIVTSKVFKQLKTAENVTDKEQVSALINTAKIYMNQNSNLLPEEKSLYIISLNELKESGLIQKSQILNPSTNEELTGCVVVRYDGSKYKYEYKEDNCDKTVLVTFDPQGGQIDETSKIVTIDEEYGELPIPTREGYTFMGWNGKNIINLEKYIRDDTYCKITSNEIRIIKASVLVECLGPSISLVNDNTYSISAYFDGSFTNRLYAFFGLSVWDRYINDNKLSTSFRYNGSEDKGRLTIFQNKQNTVVNSDLISDELIISNIMLEEGDTVTEYEPYYITPTTTVVQENAHTLKAIWEANS